MANITVVRISMAVPVMEVIANERIKRVFQYKFKCKKVIGIVENMACDEGRIEDYETDCLENLIEKF